MNNNLANEIENVLNRVFDSLGKPLDKTKYQIVDRKVPHTPKSLLPHQMGIYAFYYNNEFLKIGKVGVKSNARFFSQHYNPKSSMSNLAKSILQDEKMKSLKLNEENISQWIKDNCQRIDILLDEELGIFTLDLIEAVLHFVYQPRYEGFKTQR